jgi:hypothetical protein
LYGGIGAKAGRGRGGPASGWAGDEDEAAAELLADALAELLAAGAALAEGIATGSGALGPGAALVEAAAVAALEVDADEGPLGPSTELDFSPEHPAIASDAVAPAKRPRRCASARSRGAGRASWSSTTARSCGSSVRRSSPTRRASLGARRASTVVPATGRRRRSANDAEGGGPAPRPALDAAASLRAGPWLTRSLDRVRHHGSIATTSETWTIPPPVAPSSADFTRAIARTASPRERGEAADGGSSKESP